MKLIAVSEIVKFPNTTYTITHLGYILKHIFYLCALSESLFHVLFTLAAVRCCSHEWKSMREIAIM